VANMTLLKLARMQQGYTLENIEDELKSKHNIRLTMWSYTYVENGRRSIQKKTQRALSKILMLPVEALFNLNSKAKIITTMSIRQLAREMKGVESNARNARSK